jgi:hypothetical protein
MTALCRRVRELSGERPFLLATGMGTGEVPGPGEAEWCVVEVRAPDIIAEIRAAMRLLRLLPEDVLAALDRWDPGREALVLSPMFNELPEIAGRRVYGPRRPEWRRLEDKVVVDALWDDLGVTRAPSEVVPAEAAALRAAAGRLDRGAGTAWAGDAPRAWPRSGRSRWSPCAGRGPTACATPGRPPSGTRPPPTGRSCATWPGGSGRGCAGGSGTGAPSPSTGSWRSRASCPPS